MRNMAAAGSRAQCGSGVQRLGGSGVEGLEWLGVWGVLGLLGTM